MNTLDVRRAVEALRSGVPSGAAVFSLGSGQEALEQRFLNTLEDAERAVPEGRQVPGLLVRAGFGEGKSHLLTCFEHLALDKGYAVSRVVISKETPLQVPSKLLQSAVASLRVPDTIGRGLDEVGVLLRKQFGTPRFRALVDQLQSSTTLSARFAATVQIFEQGQHDEELADRILRFWSGDPLSVTHLKRMAKELGIKDLQLESLRARELALQTFTFLPLLMRAAGLRGWVLLIDELELIGRYTRLGRAQSYAELARWMGALDDARPGLVTVGAITADFAAEVLEGKRDLDEAGPYITLREPQSGPCAETGMRLIQRAELLKAPDRAVLQHTYGTLKDLHSRAYGWTASDVAWPEASCESAWCGCCGAWAGTSRPREPRTSWTPGE